MMIIYEENASSRGHDNAVNHNGCNDATLADDSKVGKVLSGTFLAVSPRFTGKSEQRHCAPL